jgi:hypothetical protein
MAEPVRISINEAFESLTFLPDRTPTSTDEGSADHNNELTRTHCGGVLRFAVEEVDRGRAVDDHDNLVADGVAFPFAFSGQAARRARSTGHRFETPEAVKVLSVTPQPTDHTAERPS